MILLIINRSGQEIPSGSRAGNSPGGLPRTSHILSSSLIGKLIPSIYYSFSFTNKSQIITHYQLLVLNHSTYIINTIVITGPVKRKQKNKDFLSKLQKLVTAQAQSGQSLFDLFQSNASVAATNNNDTKGNMTGMPICFVCDNERYLE